MALLSSVNPEDLLLLLDQAEKKQKDEAEAEEKSQHLLNTHQDTDRDDDETKTGHQLVEVSGTGLTSVGETEEPVSSSSSSRAFFAAENDQDVVINGREKLKRHRMEVAGRVWIPEIWGQEEFLREWSDCSAFDSCLFPSGIVSARAALIQDAKRPSSTNSPALRIDNRSCR